MTEKSLNEHISERVFGLKEQVFDYTSTMDGAWLVIDHMKKSRHAERARFTETLQIVVSQMLGLPGLMAWPDCVFYLTPETICLAALASVTNVNDSDSIQFIYVEPRVPNELFDAPMITGEIVDFMKKVRERDKKKDE